MSAKRVELCPRCGGRGTVPEGWNAGLVARPLTARSYLGRGVEPCRSCHGLGVRRCPPDAAVSARCSAERVR